SGIPARTGRRSQGPTTKAYCKYVEESQRRERRSGPPQTRNGFLGSGTNSPGPAESFETSGTRDSPVLHVFSGFLSIEARLELDIVPKGACSRDARHASGRPFPPSLRCLHHEIASALE